MAEPQDYIEAGSPVTGSPVFAEDPQSRFPENVAERIFARDVSLWNGPPEEVGGRLGWLGLPETTVADTVESFASEAIRNGVRRAVVIGMGGSALMSKVFAHAFNGQKKRTVDRSTVDGGTVDGGASGEKSVPSVPVRVSPRWNGAHITVTDTTVADSLSALKREINFGETLFIVSSKSGATVETVSVAEMFFDLCADHLGGAEKAAERFVAITDRGTPLFETAKKRGFARVFEGDETVGGRFSPLSVFGTVPAALAGADIKKILSGASAMSRRVRETGGGTALRLAAAVDAFCNRANGRFHVRCSGGIAGFDRFVEQIVGESLGKDGRRVLPVVHDPGEDEETGGAVFVCLKGDGELMELAKKTARRGVPVVITVVDGAEGLGAEVFRWEFAVAILGAKWGVNPFDQPDVEGAKSQTRRFLEIYRNTGKLPFSAPDFETDGFQFRATGRFQTVAEMREMFERTAARIKESGYISIQAFLDGETFPAVERLRAAISQKFGVTVTADLGPAYLHSSGQLHKGGGGDGFFIQLSAPAEKDIAIPATAADSGGTSFEILKNAQILGDREALERAGGAVLQITLPRGGGADGIQKAAELLGIRV